VSSCALASYAFLWSGRDLGESAEVSLQLGALQLSPP
jgi:hypothetical protein